MAHKRLLTNFELLPFFLKLEILIRLAKHSSDAIRSVLTAIPTRVISQTVTTPEVFKNMNLHHLTVQSSSLLSNSRDLIDRCVGAGNLEAHYLRGMQEYFQKENITEGLAHLQIAAQDLYDNAIYLYDIIMLSRGEPAIGKPLLDSLGWREDKTQSDNCWKNIKTSIHGVAVTRFEIYMLTYRATKATITCHRDSIATRCDTCYYFKQMKKIVFII
ncbi:hypothetical protein Bca4012_038187 [Brassica carinata]